MGKKSDKLSAMQEMFCVEYLVDLNATAAARRAGYSKNRPQDCDKVGPMLLKEPMIAARIQEGMDKRSQRTEITADLVLQEILLSARVDIADIFDEKGALKPIGLIKEGCRRAIQSVEVDELFEGSGQDRVQVGLTKKIKLNDKLKALELLGRHLKLFTDRVEHSGKVTLEEIVAGASDQKDKK